MRFGSRRDFIWQFYHGLVSVSLSHCGGVGDLMPGGVAY